MRLLSSLILTALIPIASVKAQSEAPFLPNMESLASYECPDWFRDAKFGIWAHWGPQCEPENGDWYAREMYMKDKAHYAEHVKRYGHPTEVGFKEVIHQWKAERFDPDTLVEFYRKSGARYFVAMANHHDNLDLWNSKHQPWNSVAVGPKRDLIAGWAGAAQKAGLRFGVSVHAARTWRWWEVTRNADKDGPLGGKTYDGRLTKADGAGLWWEGLDPQDLYEQRHVIGGPPGAAYVERFFNRVDQLVTDYKPDLLYFDDAVLPLYKDAPAQGLEMAAKLYNDNIKRNGKNEAVLATKSLNDQQRKAFLYDIERGKAATILPQPWQTDTCIGQWHYSRSVYDKNEYKNANTVIAMMADIVSKNGNLLLSVPLRRDGQPDEKEIAIVSGIGAWLESYGEAIYATRPWLVFGEGPAKKASEPGRHGGIKDAITVPLTAEDIRFTQSKDGLYIYAIVMASPSNGEVLIRSLGNTGEGAQITIASARLVGAKQDLPIARNESGLRVKLPADQATGLGIFALRLAVSTNP
jgi:alpha-L-fucosidase